MAKVLITGATGFIGSHLAERLLEEGHEVFALIRRRGRWLPKGVKVIHGDLRGELPELKGFDHVFHLAALTRAIKPSQFFEVNTLGTKYLLERILRDGGVRGRFIFLSSLSAQGPTRRGAPLSEDVPPHPVSPYGLSKLMAEEALMAFRSQIHIVILRPAIVYGPRDEYMLEFFRLIRRGILPLLMDEQWLSLCYVQDVVQALILASQRDIPSGEVLLISDGHQYPLQGIADMVASILGVSLRKVRIPLVFAKTVALLSEILARARKKPPAFNLNKFREAVQEAWICDISKARRLLGFEPKWGLREGLSLTLCWYRKQGWL